MKTAQFSATLKKTSKFPGNPKEDCQVLGNPEEAEQFQATLLELPLFQISLVSKLPGGSLTLTSTEKDELMLNLLNVEVGSLLRCAISDNSA
jgi:hypothetical protein